MTFDCYRRLIDLLQQEPNQAVLATVINVRGSVPREVGAKMVIGADGSTFQTIGGGAGEAKVIRQAMEVLKTGKNQLIEIDLTGTSTSSDRLTEGICGGKMQVWLTYWAGNAAIDLGKQITAFLQCGESVTLATPLTNDHLPYIVSVASDSIASDSIASDSIAFNSTTPDISEAFVETLYPAPLLLIVGAGHVGIQLAKVASLMGFQVAIQDDRPEWANPQRYPQACHIFTESISVALDQLAQHAQLYAALVTRGYPYDLAALSALLQRDRPCRYIGMIGSEKRVQQVFQVLQERGLSQAKLRSVYAPIGLDIGALTPEEIAVSIGAEMILVRRGGTGQPLSCRMEYKKKE
jgi:xanthine dehydrogenase accessory factor